MKLKQKEQMKLMYYSSDDREVIHVREEFTHAGIRCEVRQDRSHKLLHEPPCMELWICNDRDCHRAMMLCVQLGLGFARRAPKNSFIESWSELSSGSLSAEDLDVEGADKNFEAEEVHPMERRKRKAG